MGDSSGSLFQPAQKENKQEPLDRFLDEDKNRNISAWQLLVDPDDLMQDEIYSGLFVALMFFMLLIANLRVIRIFTEKYLPRSLLFCAIGLIIGAATFHNNFVYQAFKPYFFTWLLVPPIMTTSTYRLSGAEFLRQLDCIAFLAIFGTLGNILLLAGTLHFIDRADIVDRDYLNFSSYVTLSTVIAAVDPVAVLSVFETFNVQDSLTSLVLGESLLNGAVTLVVFRILTNVADLETFGWDVYPFAAAAFVTVGAGGIIIGLVIGTVSALFCKMTVDELHIFEPVWMLGAVYFSLLFAEGVNWSGSLAIISCCLAQKRYAFKHMHENSVISVECFMEGCALACQTVIFLLLGASIFSVKHDPQTWFLALCVFGFIIIYRFFIVYTFGFIVNKLRRVAPLTKGEMFILSYSGLRGSIAYAMSKDLVQSYNNYDENTASTNKIFQSITLIVILLTCFLQGGTVRFLVKWFGFEQHARSPRDITKDLILDAVVDETMSGMAHIAGLKTMHTIIDRLDTFDRIYFQSFFGLDQVKREGAFKNEMPDSNNF